MAFIVMCTLPIVDIAYTIGNIQVCSAFDGNSQALAGSIFSIATRVRPMVPNGDDRDDHTTSHII